MGSCTLIDAPCVSLSMMCMCTHSQLVHSQPAKKMLFEIYFLFALPYWFACSKQKQKKKQKNACPLGFDSRFSQKSALGEIAGGIFRSHFWRKYWSYGRTEWVLLNYGSWAFIWYTYRSCGSKTLRVMKLQKLKYVIFGLFQRPITPKF